jgi:integrase
VAQTTAASGFIDVTPGGSRGDRTWARTDEVKASGLRHPRRRRPRPGRRRGRPRAPGRGIDRDRAFTTTIATRIEAAAVTRAFARALERAGLPHSRFHDLRHAAATSLLAQGFTLENAKNLLGHSSIVLTSNTYGHVLEQRQRAVARGMDVVGG